jgi:hypothetical protein
MKKLILAAFALTAAASVFAQGTVLFNNRLTSTTHVWGPGTPNTLSLIGLGSNDTPVGNTAYAASGMSLIGASGTTLAPGNAATTLASLIAAPGAGAAESALQPQAQSTTFRTGGAQGDIAAITVTLANVPNDAAAASFEMVAWDDTSLLYPTWALASVAWQEGLIAAGHSSEFTLTAIGGTANTAPPTVIPTSFNLYMINVPEPTSFALLGLGAAAMLIFRRRK